VPGYNVMGPAKASLESCARALAYELGERNVRVNCLSPGPVRTLAAKGIRGFAELQRAASERAPLQRNANMEEITGVATFLASGYASAITGQTIHVDCGFSAVLI
jgi:enoyl-[acyl-carrier protein] reductase I